MNLQSIATATAEHFGVDMETMQGYSRFPEHVRPRQVYCHIAAKWTDAPATEIGRVIRRDHTTVASSIRRAAQMDVADDIAAIERVACFDWHSIPFTTRNNPASA